MRLFSFQRKKVISEICNLFLFAVIQEKTPVSKESLCVLFLLGNRYNILYLYFVVIKCHCTNKKPWRIIISMIIVNIPQQLWKIDCKSLFECGSRVINRYCFGKSNYFCGFTSFLKILSYAKWKNRIKSIFTCKLTSHCGF